MTVSLESWIAEKFEGLLDHAGKPYYGHCEFVACFARQYAVALGMTSRQVEIVYQAGLCHDLLEDTDTPVSDLMVRTSPEVVKVVRILTHAPTVSYDDYFEQVKTNRLATVVKLADATHNSMLTRFDVQDRSGAVKADCQKYAGRMLILQKTILSWR